MKLWIGTFLFFAYTILAHAGGKIYEPQDRKYGQKKPYTNQQKINRGLGDKKKKYTTCVYRGGNKTYTLMYEDNCPAQYRCVYNPWSKEPNIDDIVDSLNSIKKGNK